MALTPFHPPPAPASTPSAAATPPAPMALARELRGVEVFAGLSDDELLLVAACCRRRAFYRGEVIFEDSDPGEDMFVILRGRVTIRLESIMPYYEMVVSTLGEGQVIGEMALLVNQERSATAVCGEPTEALEVNGKRLRQVFEQQPHVGYIVVSNLARILCDRLGRMNRRLLSVMRVNLY